jgi:hypothetical protein
VPQKSFHLPQFEARLLAPGTYRVAEAVPADVGKTKGQGNRLDVRLEQLRRPERPLALRKGRGKDPIARSTMNRDRAPLAQLAEEYDVEANDKSEISRRRFPTFR